MKRLITSLLTLLMILTVSATVKEREFNHRVLPGAPNAGMVKIKKQNENVSSFGGNSDPSKRKLNTAAKEDEPIFEVKCIFKYDEKRYEPSFAAAYNADGGYNEEYDWGNDYIYLFMTPGVYDFRATFRQLQNNACYDNRAWAYLILEDIEVKGDMEIVFDASLITETISFETYNPDGEKSTVRYVRYLNENWEWEIISEGNIYDFIFNNYIIHKDYGIVGGFGGNAGGAEVEAGPLGEWKTEMKSNIYINKVSDKYLLSQVRLLYNNEECWLVPMFADGSNSQIVTNKGDKYSELYEVNFAKTPAGNNCEIVSDSPYEIYWTMNDALGGLVSAGVTSPLDSFHRFRFCATQSSMVNPKYINMMKFKREDIAIRESENIYDDEGNFICEVVWYTNTTINTPIFVLGMESCNLYPVIDDEISVLKLEGGQEYDFSFQKTFSFDVTPQDMPVFGSTPQYMRFLYQDLKYQWCDYPFPAIDYESYGYYGDNIPNYGNAKFSVSVNGNEKATSMAEFAAWQWECMESPMERGLFTFDYLNDGIEIDGLASVNSAKVCFDNSFENLRIPLIQAVQFRDGNNRVTDRFIEPTEGNLLIAGGDFCEKGGEINSEGESSYWYEIEQCDLLVEYAPHGSNDFAPIDMNVDGDAVLGFGYPYKGSLESIDRESATGWFDLRILLTDAEGNSHEQIISPAFKIEKLTGAQQVCINKANLRIIERRVEADNAAEVEVFTLSGQKIENNGLPSGIYIARSGESIAKLIVK